MIFTYRKKQSEILISFTTWKNIYNIIVLMCKYVNVVGYTFIMVLLQCVNPIERQVDYEIRDVSRKTLIFETLGKLPQRLHAL